MRLDRGVSSRRSAGKEDRAQRLLRRTLRDLELLTDAGQGTDRLVGMASVQGRRLRRELQRAAPLPGLCTPGVRERWPVDWEEVCCHLHDTTLQVLDYVAGQGMGMGLSGHQIATIATEAVADLREWMTGTESRGELVDELRRLVTDASRRAGTPVELVVDGIPARVDATEAVAMTGAVREALTNVRKHAKASRATVRLVGGPRGATVTVTDDGVGFDRAGTDPGRFGLANSIRGRMERVGGRATVVTAPGRGTRVTMRLAAPKERR